MTEKRIAWVTHRDVTSRSGGAEAADDDMIRKAPDDVHVMLVYPGGVAPDLEEFDQVVVTGVYSFSEHEIALLARSKPVVWAHDDQFSGHWLYSEARTFIALTPEHARRELDNHSRLDKSKVTVNPGWFDTTDIRPSYPKGTFALWAHRPAWHKGLHLAHEWAQNHGVELEVMVGRPHEEVIAKMGQARYFVLLSEIFDPGPRAVIEAQLCDCDLILDNVGTLEMDQDEIRQYIDTAADRFWEVVLS